MTSAAIRKPREFRARDKKIRNLRSKAKRLGHQFIITVYARGDEIKPRG